MQTMHLFAGGGGGLLGDLILGNNPVCAVEWDKYACQILRERAADGWFPDLRVYEGDVRLFNPSEYEGRVDCIHAGFPCQDISVAGKQAGVGEDTRSGLYREVLRIADVVRPGELFMENVSAILSNGLGTVLADLSARGYSARWMCLRASDVGANHHRDRWWLLARRIRNTKHAGQSAAEIAASIAQGSNDNATRAQQAVKSARSSEQCARVADTASEGLPQRGQSEWSEGATEISAGVESESERFGADISNANAARLQRLNGSAKRYRPPSPQRFAGQCRGNIGRQTKPAICGVDDVLAFGMDANWYAEEPNVGRVTSVSKDRASQLKALGNGQVPLQMAVAYSMLQELFA